MLGLFFVVCLVLWTASLIVYFVIEKFKHTQYYGKVKSIEFFRTAKQYKTLLVVKTKIEDKMKGGKPGRVIERFSVILPEVHLKKHLHYTPETVREKDGSHVEIFYLDYTMSRLLMEAMQDWFPEDNVEIGIKIDEVDDQPSGEEREYALLDINHYSTPYYRKQVSKDDFLLIFCQGTKFSLKIGESVLDNVEAYIKITSDMLHRPVLAIAKNRIVKESRLYAYQLDGFLKNDEDIWKWIGTDTFCNNAYTCIR